MMAAGALRTRGQGPREGQTAALIPRPSHSRCTCVCGVSPRPCRSIAEGEAMVMEPTLVWSGVGALPSSPESPFSSSWQPLFGGIAITCLWFLCQELESYIASYSGSLQIHRLLFIARHCPPLQVPALRSTRPAHPRLHPPSPLPLSFLQSHLSSRLQPGQPPPAGITQHRPP